MKYNKSQEAYFGKEYGSLGTIIEKHIVNIREIYNKIDSNDYRTVEKNAKTYKNEMLYRFSVGSKRFCVSLLLG